MIGIFIEGIPYGFKNQNPVKSWNYQSLSPTPKYWSYISNAPVSAPLSLFVWMSGRRWAIEQSFEESKSDVGMDHYEVRTYEGHKRQDKLSCINTSDSFD